MGFYIYLDKSDLIRMRRVYDTDVMELLDEALKHDKSLLISEHEHYFKKHWFGKVYKETIYSVYHETFFSDGKSALEARHQHSASGKKEVVIAYLYGIINGALKSQQNQLTPVTDKL